MCGISGAVAVPAITADVLQSSLTAIHHRGPDDCGVHIDSDVAMGMRRLAIIDIAGGRQPVANEDGTVHVVFNGEIYNHAELRAQLQTQGHQFRSGCDTEVLVHLYEQQGLAMFRMLRGMFAVAIWDSRCRRLVLARDPFGKKPLYYACAPHGGLLFASELKALRPLAEAAGIGWRIDPQGIYDYLSLGTVPQPSTAFQGVQSMRPGSHLCWEEQTTCQHSYWQFTPQRSHLSESDACSAVRQQIADAVQIRLESEVPLGVFLSGGIDSSIVAYEAAKHLGSELQTFTVGVDDPTLNEADVAARTAQHLGIRNVRLRLTVSPLEELQRLVRQYDQPFGDASAIPCLAISRLARQHVTVVLNGDGGDELFGGYRRYVAAHWAGVAGLAPSLATRLASNWLLAASVGRRRSTVGFASRFLRGLSQTSGARYLAWTNDFLSRPAKEACWRGGAVTCTENRIAGVLPANRHPLDTQQMGDIQMNLLSGLLVKMDIASMAASLEARSPLLDVRLADLAARLPRRLLIRGTQTKAILRSAYRGVLPEEVLAGRKRGFEPPVARWFAGELRELLHDSLGDRSARVRSYVDDAFIDELLHPPGRVPYNATHLLYAMLVLELWLREVAAPASMPQPVAA